MPGTITLTKLPRRVGVHTASACPLFRPNDSNADGEAFVRSLREQGVRDLHPGCGELPASTPPAVAS
jgi:hypothetical protein